MRRRRRRGGAPPQPCATLPDSLLELLCQLPPVEEGVSGSSSSSSSSGAQGGGSSSGSSSLLLAGAGCRGATRDACLSLLRLMQALVELEAQAVAAAAGSSGSGGSSTGGGGAATAAAGDSGCDYCCPSEALVPWRDRDTANVVLAAALAPHVVGAAAADGEGGRWRACIGLGVSRDCAWAEGSHGLHISYYDTSGCWSYRSLV